MNTASRERSNSRSSSSSWNERAVMPDSLILRGCLAKGRAARTGSSRPGVSGQDVVGELVARRHSELSEDLAEAVVDRRGAHEEPGRDRGVGRSGAREPGDLSLLRCEVASGFEPAMLRAFTGGRQ